MGQRRRRSLLHLDQERPPGNWWAFGFVMDSTQQARARLERKIDMILDAVSHMAKALADEQDEDESFTLDGEPVGKARDATQEL